LSIFMKQTTYLATLPSGELLNSTMVKFNAPTRIGHATPMPGDIVLGKNGVGLFRSFRVLHIPSAVFQAPDKAVIRSEALRRSIANRGLYGAESKDPGDAC
jgi:hypothetical protein